MHLWGIAYKCLFQESRFSMLVGWPWTIFLSIIFVPSNLTLLHMVTPISPNFWLKNPRVSQDFSDFCSKNHQISGFWPFPGSLEDPLTLDADACVTFCELSVPVVARLCEVLGLPGPSGCHWKTMEQKIRNSRFEWDFVWFYMIA